MYTHHSPENKGREDRSTQSILNYWKLGEVETLTRFAEVANKDKESYTSVPFAQCTGCATLHLQEYTARATDQIDITM